MSITSDELRLILQSSRPSQQWHPSINAVPLAAAQLKAQAYETRTSTPGANGPIPQTSPLFTREGHN